MSNIELDEYLVSQTALEQLETERTLLLEYIRTKRAGKVIRMLKAVDNVVDIDNAGYELVIDTDKASYADALSGEDVFGFASAIAGQTQTEYRAEFIAKYETRLAKKKELLDVINGLGKYFEDNVFLATDTDTLTQLREKMNVLLSMSFEEATPEAINAFLAQ
jgi:hypothetical protein